MLFEVGILFIGYVGVRLFENNQPQNVSKKPIKIKKNQTIATSTSRKNY